MITLMPRQQSITEARSNFARLVREAESGEIIELTRRRESVAVLIGLRQYERLAARPRRFSQAWTEFTREVDLSDLASDPDQIFDGARCRS
jgi:prevent-host-death family protein